MKVSEFLELTNKQLPRTYLDESFNPIGDVHDISDWNIVKINVVPYLQGSITKHVEKSFPYTSEIKIAYELIVVPQSSCNLMIDKYRALTTHTYISGEMVYVLKSTSGIVSVEEFVNLGDNLLISLKDTDGNYVEYNDSTCKYDLIKVEAKLVRDKDRCTDIIKYDIRSKSYTFDFKIILTLTVRKPAIKIPADLPIVEDEHTLIVEKPAPDNTDGEYVLSIHKRC